MLVAPHVRLVGLSLLLALAHAANLLEVHGPLLLIAATTRAGQAFVWTRRNVRGAPPADQLMGIRRRLVCEEHL